MNDALTNRLAYLRTALFAMLGYVLLEWLRTALRANTTTVWFLTGLLALGGLAWIVVDLTSARRLHSPPRALQPRAAEIRSRGGEWRFDETDTAQFVVGDDVLPFVPAVRPVLERALLDIQDDPLGNPREVVGGEVVYVKRLRPAAAEHAAIPALLLAFKATQRDRKIRRLALDRAADETASPRAQETYAALERVMATATRRAKR